MRLPGKNMVLVPAKESDREKIFTWLTQSDLTASMFGPPHYPDHPVPSWEEFCTDYSLDFFNESGDGKGRCYIIFHRDTEVGTLGYDLLDKIKDRAVLDIWMRSEKYCGRGYGSQSLEILCDHLHETYNISNFVISPSVDNQRAVAAYRKAGFDLIGTLTREAQEKEFGLSEYPLNALMKKSYPRPPAAGR